MINFTAKHLEYYVLQLIALIDTKYIIASLITFLLILFIFFRKKGNNISLKKAKSKNYIDSLSWQDFEVLIAKYYKKQGYKATIAGGGGADNGIDVLLEKKRDKKIVQCKHWKKNAVGVVIIREMYGLMVSESASEVIIVTSGRFTKDAYKFAKGKPIKLINGQKLSELLTG